MIQRSLRHFLPLFRFLSLYGAELFLIKYLPAWQDLRRIRIRCVRFLLPGLVWSGLVWSGLFPVLNNH